MIIIQIIVSSKFGVFPSAAIGWNISNESFFKDKPISETISNLKYRLSWGKNGNEAISAYSTLPIFQLTII